MYVMSDSCKTVSAEKLKLFRYITSFSTDFILDLKHL